MDKLRASADDIFIEPALTLMDCHGNTAGLDPKERLRLRQYISDLARNKIVFLTTHIVSDIESIANDVLLMKQGELVAHGAPDALIAAVHGQNLEDVYMAYLGVD